MSVDNGLEPPRIVAVVGASELGGKNYYGARLLRNLLDAGSDITAYAVNPRYEGGQIMGVPAFGKLTNLPQVPDTVLIATPVAAVPDVLVEAGELGVATCVIVTRESGGDAARTSFHATIREIADRYPMRIIGPNSMGVLSGTARLNGSFASGAHDGALRPGPLGMISQSGSSISYLLEINRHGRLGYSWLISTGDEAAESLETLFEHVVEDPDTKVIALFVEGVADGPRFRRAALRARVLGKPVILLQTGLSAVGRQAVHTHTGRMAGAEEAFRAVAAESGLIRVPTFERFYDTAKVLAEQAVHRSTIPHRRRAVVLTSSGGSGAYTVDHLSSLGWTVPPLSDDIRSELERLSGQHDLQNPVDVTGSWADPELFPRLLRVMADDSTIDSFLISTGAGGTLALPVAEALAAVRSEIPQELYVGWVGISSQVAAVLESAGINAFPDPARAVLAAEASAQFRRNGRDGRSGAELVELLAATPEQVEPPETAHATGGEIWTAGECIDSLTSSGVPCVRSMRSDGLDAAEVERLAAEAGFPVAVKLDSPQLSHKTDKGAVAIGVANVDELRVQLARLTRIAEGERLADPRVIVQSMADGVEVLVGLKRDPSFGLILAIGVGGVGAELYGGGIETTVLPTTRTGLADLVDRHPMLNRLLDGYRGAPPCDRTALIDLLHRYAEWGLSRGSRLQEADLNPVMVGRRGAVVVDARAVWSA
ncbi:acetate--CoA ligase family protein [Pseudonocardia zijingensis]|uniref:Acetate--CoA ligase n=1 Tax=Pseudonocardia zijingensis TaxID=153376 RepID=A0ABN1Q0L9_9PSEU